MKTEVQCEQLAKKAVEQYVELCRCHDERDVARALQKMCAVAEHALKAAQTGKNATFVQRPQ